MTRDRYHRRIDYLRISLTDNCNLRCVYCMSLRGLSFAPHEELLTAAEIEQVVRAAVSVGFRKFRLTGGEPTLRVDLLDIVARLNAIEGVEDLAMTTNGVLLPTMADALRDAGLRRVNVHINTLDPEHLQRVMRFGSKDALWAGIEAAERAGFSPIKLNVVVARDYNEGDVVELARLTVDRPWHVRFIELMPLGAGPCASLSLAKRLVVRERAPYSLPSTVRHRVGGASTRTPPYGRRLTYPLYRPSGPRSCGHAPNRECPLAGGAVWASILCFRHGYAA